jgi:PAS domain S-box-containing protein
MTSRDPSHDAEADLRARLFAAAQAIGRFGTYAWNPLTGEARWSERFHALLGRGPDDLDDSLEAFFRTVHPDDQGRVAEAVDRFSATGSPDVIPFRVVWPDGQIRHLEGRARRVLDENGTVLRMVGVLLDVTEQVEERRQLRRQQVLLDEAQELGRMGAWSLDVETGALTWSRATYAIYGLDPSVAVDTHVALSRLAPEDRPRAGALVRRALDEGTPYDAVLRVIRPNGEERSIRAIARVERDEGGRVRRLFGMVQDITEAEREHQARLRTDRLQSLGQLAGGLAHDINNYLTVARLGIGLALESGDDEALREALLGVEAARGVAARLVTVSDERAPARQAVDLADRVSAMARFTLRGRATKLELELPTHLPPIHADPIQLDQLVSNLVLNASQAMDGAGRVRVAVGTTDDGRIRIDVRDEGPGVDPALLDQLFEPYVTTRPHGTGLGLATCRLVAERHDGTIEVVPSDTGAHFRVELPIREPPAASPPAPSGPPVALEGRTVLVYDDEPTVQRVLGRALVRLGARVHACTSEAAVWRTMYEEGAVDAAILDAVLPGERGGVAVAQDLAARHPQVALVLSSGNLEAHRLEEAPVHALLPKPYSLGELRHALERALAHRRA